jgi:hypothetical protein
MVNLMKRNTSSKNKKTKDKNYLKVDKETVKILRTVGDREVFYFYESIGKPTGEIARNLPDFLDKVKSVNLESLVFHLQRNDFQNWVEKVLGDFKLAAKLGRISSSDTKNIRMNICTTVDNRIKELKESSATMLVGEYSTVLLPSS